MKIVILGCGSVGEGVGGLLATEPEVQEIICADANISVAENLCKMIKTLNSEVKIQAKSVDALDAESVAGVAKDCDLVFNVTYPNCNVPILKGCINVGAAYIDFLSFPPSPGMPAGTTMDDLLALDEKAKQAGITAITNMGASPGFSNLAVRYIVDQLDSASKVRFKWFDKVTGKDDLIGTWYAGGLIAEWLGGPSPIVWEKGEFRNVDLLGSAEEYDFPKPIGRQTVYTATFHPEIHMIPKYLPREKAKSIEYVDLMGGMSVGNWKTKDLLLEAVRRQTIKPTIDQKIQTGEDLTELFAKSFSAPGDFRECFDKGIVTDEVTALLIEVTGQRKGKKVVHSLILLPFLRDVQQTVPWSNTVGFGTALSAEIVGLMILRGEIKQKGVLVPDLLENPKEIINMMEEKGAKVIEKIVIG
jgi:saccharopine dehydrogenase-like NADP-dependent oxidoreductase